MKNVIIAITAVLLLSSISCKKGQESTNVNQKMTEVMAIHDEVMPKMSVISKLVGELKPMADSSDTASPYHQAITDLQAAHKSMMDWMKGFGDRFDSEEILKGKPLTAEKEKWLDEEEVKVKAMRDQVYRSIEQAEKLLEQ